MKSSRINVVLNRPIYGRNVGMSARAMANMGAGRLIVIGARGEIGVDAKQGAAHAQDILAGVTTYSDLNAFMSTEGEGVRIALSGKDARLKASDELLPTLRIAIAEPSHRIRDPKEPIYLFFGPEDDGLSAEEMEICHFVCRLPTFGEITSLNLSHAVLLACYLVQSELGNNRQPVQNEPTPVVDPRNAIHRWLEALGFDLSSPRINIEKTLTRILFSRCPTPEELRQLDTVLEQTIRKLQR